jgi:hypothetical protein
MKPRALPRAQADKAPLALTRIEALNSSAKGAVSSPAWGNAPGFEEKEKPISAESAIHFQREFDA